ncbi:RNI-like protein [Martensiomyces pterosporus]|nr:RNI-like protein [Martensiomyces pterosporus]
MDAAAFASLTDVLCLHNLPRLRSVDISQNQVGGGTGELAGKALCKLLTHASSISTLSLGWNKLTLSDLRHMVPPSTGVGAPVVYGVNYLDLRANPLTPPAKHSNSKRRNAESADTSGSETWLPALVDSLPHLTHVLLAQATISDGMLAALLRSLARPSAHIEYIGLEWLGLGNRLSVLRAILSNLSPPPTRRSLHLNLSANNLGDAGVQAIASSNAVLSSLTLSCNFITERGTACLAQWLPASGLTDLDLSDNHFGDQGVSALVGSGSLERSSSIYYTQIKSLGLASCCLSDTSLRLLATALDCRWAPLLSLRILRNSRISPGMKIALSPR